MDSLFKKYYSNYTGLPIAAWQGIFVGFFESTLVGVCYFLTIYFVTELHMSIANAGIIMACYGIGTIAGGTLGGKLSDLIPPRTVSIICLTIQAIAYFLLLKIKTPSLLMLNLFTIGIGSYGFITSNHVWTLGECDKNERLKAINLLDVVSNLGLAFAGFIIGFLSTKDFTYLFLISSFFLILTATSLCVLDKKQLKNIERCETSEVASSPNSKLVYFVLLCLFLVGFIISQTSSTYPIYLQTIFPIMGTRSFGILFTLNAIMVVLFQGPIVNHLGHFNNILLIGLGAFLLGLGMFILNVAYAFWIAIASCIAMTFGEIIFFSIAQLICYENGPANKKGNSLGSYRTVYAASRVMGPAVGGMIYQHLNGESLWALCFMLGFACMLASFYMHRCLIIAVNANATS